MPNLAHELSNRCRNYHPDECIPFRVSDIESVCAQIAELEADRGAVTAKVNTRLLSERDKLREALRLCASQAGLPDPAEACRQILLTIEAALPIMEAGRAMHKPQAAEAKK